MAEVARMHHQQQQQQQQAHTASEHQMVDYRNQFEPQSGKGLAIEPPHNGRLTQLKNMAENSPRVKKQHALTEKIHNSPRVIAQYKMVAAVQRQSVAATQLSTELNVENELTPFKKEPSSPIQKAQELIVKPSNTGFPDSLKTGIEHLSGMTMDNVKKQNNSVEPAQLQGRGKPALQMRVIDKELEHGIQLLSKNYKTYQLSAISEAEKKEKRCELKQERDECKEGIVSVTEIVNDYRNRLNELEEPREPTDIRSEMELVREEIIEIGNVDQDEHDHISQTYDIESPCPGGLRDEQDTFNVDFFAERRSRQDALISILSDLKDELVENDELIDEYQSALGNLNEAEGYLDQLTDNYSRFYSTRAYAAERMVIQLKKSKSGAKFK